MIKRFFFLIIVGFLFLNIVALAGTFSPTPVTPGASDYTLSDIYNKISSSTYSYSSHTFAPATSPNSTYLILTEIWDAIPPFKTLVADDLSSGLLPGGIYSTVTDLATIEPNLIPENIALGATVFGVEGSYEAVVEPESFSDSFDNLNNWTCVSGSCVIEDGSMVVSGNGWAKLNVEGPNNFVMTLRYKERVNEARMNVSFKQQSDNTNGYGMLVSAGDTSWQNFALWKNGLMVKSAV